jgi:hypothetical protein
MPIVIEIAETPPSLNQVGSRGHWHTFYGQKTRWQNQIEMWLIAKHGAHPLEVPVTVRARLRFPQYRERDEGNFRMLLEKSVGDALVNGGWIPTDTPEYYRFQTVEFAPEKGPNLTTLIITPGGTRWARHGAVRRPGSTRTTVPRSSQRRRRP